MNYEERIADPIVASIGEFGRWQLRLFFAVAMIKFPVGWHQLAFVFLTPPVEFHCVQPNNETDRCSKECTEIAYDRTIFQETVITEWDLVCGRKYLANLSQTIFMFGTFIGNVLFGLWSDKKGRQPSLVFAMRMQLVCGILSSISPWFWSFNVLRFFVGVATGGSMLTSFVLIMENIGRSKREVIPLLSNAPFNIAHATLPIFAYYFRDWRKYYFAISIISVGYCLVYKFFSLIPESPRWLLSVGQIDRAAKILEKAATYNKLPTQNIRNDLEEATRHKIVTEQGTVLDLFRYPNLRMKTICISYNWFVCGCTYYGVSQYIVSLGGNIFMNVAISGCLTILGTPVAIAMCHYLGRKPSMMISNGLIGICMFAIAFLPPTMDPWVTVMLASMALVGASMALPSSYLYSGEIFPTVVRNVGIGVSSMVARWGSMLAPFVAQAGDINYWIPPIIFGVISIFGAFLTLALPETRGSQLPETIEDGETFI